MKWLPLVSVAVLAAGCARGVVVNLGDRLPESAFIAEQDPAFREGWEWIQKGDPDRAIKLFQLSAAPLEKKHIAFGYAFLAKNKIGAAREQFEKSLALAAENYEAEVGLASTFELTGERENAFHVYSRLLARYPDDSRIREKYLAIKTAATQKYLAEAQAEKAAGNDEKYIRDLERATYYSPEDTAIQLEIAEHYFQKRKWEPALARFQELQAKEPNNADILLRLADIYETTEKYDRALLTIDALLALKPGDQALEARKRRIKDRFLTLSLPPKFKDIFFKKEVNREDLAALIGFYFQDFIKIGDAPVILTDIDSSYARDEIMKVASTGIIKPRPNHTFDRFSQPDRATFAEILKTLIAYLEGRGYQFLFPPKETTELPADISPQHKNWEIITFLIQSQVFSLDGSRNFNPTSPLTPAEVVSALGKLINSLSR